MTKRKRRTPTKESSNVLEQAAAETEAEETVDTGMEAEPEAAPTMSDDLTIEMRPAQPEAPCNEEPEPPMHLEAQVASMLVRMLPSALEPHLARMDQRSRDRMHSVLAEATARDTSIEDAIEEVQTFAGEVEARLNDQAERLERVEEACGLRPSLLTTTEAAVARLDEMAQGGKLKAGDIRAIHRTLRAAVQEERAKRQG